MQQKIDQQDVEVISFDDELTDEALDRFAGPIEIALCWTSD
jgi:hypothetical protein